MAHRFANESFNQMVDFLLKLLPVDALYLPLEWNKVFSLILIVFIILYGLISILRFSRKLTNIERIVSDAAEKLKPLKKGQIAHFGDVIAVFRTVPTLEAIWTEYEPSLIKAESPPRIYKVESSEYYFNQDTLISEQINIRYWHAVPAILVGLGILGTFIGLCLGLSQFNLGSKKEIEESIKTLMTGMTTAFATSVWGMFLSLVFSGYEKRRFNAANKAISRLNEQLNRLFTLTMQEKISLEQSTLLETMSAALKSFSTDLAEKIGFALDAVLTTRLATVEKALNQIQSDGQSSTQVMVKAIQSSGSVISQELQDSVGKIMLEKLSPALEGVAKSLDKLVEVVERLREEKQDSAADAIKSLADEFRKSLTEVANTEFKQLAVLLEAAGKVIGNFPERIEDMMVGMDEQYKNLTKFLNEITEQFSKQIEEASGTQQKTLKETADSITDSTQKTIADLARVNAEVINKQKESHENVDRLLGAMKEVLLQSNDVIDKASSLTSALSNVTTKIINASDAVSKAAGGLGSSSETLKVVVKKFEEQTEIHLKTNQETLRKLTDSMQQSEQLLKHYTQQSSVIKEGLSGVFKELEGGLTRYSETTRVNLNNMLTDIAEKLASVTGGLATQIEALDDAIEKFLDTLEGPNKE